MCWAAQTNGIRKRVLPFRRLHHWTEPERESTARYSESGSRGAGANPAARVPWARKLSDAEIKSLTPENVLGGADKWNPKARAAVSTIAPLDRARTRKHSAV